MMALTKILITVVKFRRIGRLMRVIVRVRGAEFTLVLPENRLCVIFPRIVVSMEVLVTLLTVVRGEKVLIKTTPRVGIIPLWKRNKTMRSEMTQISVTTGIMNLVKDVTCPTLFVKTRTVVKVIRKLAIYLGTVKVAAIVDVTEPDRITPLTKFNVMTSEMEKNPVKVPDLIFPERQHVGLLMRLFPP